MVFSYGRMNLQFREVLLPLLDNGLLRRDVRIICEGSMLSSCFLADIFLERPCYNDAMVTLTVENLSARYGSRRIFAAISLELRPHEVLVVTGANGSGKSTFLRILAGLQVADRGAVYYISGDTRLTPLLARPAIGFVAPELALYRELTARENLRFFAAMHGLPDSATAIDRLLHLVGLHERADDRLAAYSSGMQQRLRYAFALLHEPTVLLLDEPTVTLDERGTAVVTDVIDIQRRRGIVVIATNDSRERSYGDVILELGALAY
jgi:heme exporter protein A